MGMYPHWLEEGRASAQNALLALWPQQTSTHPPRPSSNVTFPGHQRQQSLPSPEHHLHRALECQQVNAETTRGVSPAWHPSSLRAGTGLSAKQGNNNICIHTAYDRRALQTIRRWANKLSAYPQISPTHGSVSPSIQRAKIMSARPRVQAGAVAAIFLGSPSFSYVSLRTSPTASGQYVFFWKEGLWGLEVLKKMGLKSKDLTQIQTQI